MKGELETKVTEGNIYGNTVVMSRDHISADMQSANSVKFCVCITHRMCILYSQQHMVQVCVYVIICKGI